MNPFLSEASSRAARIAREALSRPGSPFQELPARLVVVDVARQDACLLVNGEGVTLHPVSTAAAGVGGEAGSMRTPPGWHRVHERIGDGAPPRMAFSSRVATGQAWDGAATPDDLILGRVLTLEGLEIGVNRGPGHDSLERYIYLHGTNHEESIGLPASHGCVRLRTADMLELFDRVREGDAVLIVGGAVPALPWPGPGRFHYAGIGGSGMSALAQYQVMRGGRASGSDRAFDRGERPGSRSQLEALGITITPQDGSGIFGDCAQLILSTAVEQDVPDFAEATRLGVPTLHRSEVLARFVHHTRSIAVTGTSGKSTVVAMIFEILRGAGRDPSVIAGGELRALQTRGMWGNAWAGASDLLVVEADESDGSVVRYRPAVGVALNLQKDHKEMGVVAEMFRKFRAQAREGFVCGESDNLAEFAVGSTVFGVGPGASVRGASVELGPDGSDFEAGGVRFRLPVPGRHNVENALAAIASCALVGVSYQDMVAPLAAFQGVARRFQVVGGAGGVEVVDDFAHNPAKLEAAIRTAQRRAARVLAVYQPHGYGPTRFLWPDFVETFSSALRSQDRLWLLEVYYAGGTATRDFSASDIVRDIAARGTRCEFAPSRDELARAVVAEARPGDLILIMGARDPSLTGLARNILAQLPGAASSPIA